MKVLTPACTCARRPMHLAAFGQHRLAQVGDGLHVFERFGGVADHKVQLDRCPAARVDLAGGLQQLFGADGLVDDLAHALGGGFGGQGEPAAAQSPSARPSSSTEKDSMRSEGSEIGQVASGKTLGDRLDQLGDMRIVGGGQGEQGNLFVAGVVPAPASIAATISSTGRSRTGRVIIPAWQKRQPRVQPRMISIGDPVVDQHRCRAPGSGSPAGGSWPTMRLTTGSGASGSSLLNARDGAIRVVMHFVQRRAHTRPGCRASACSRLCREPRRWLSSAWCDIDDLVDHALRLRRSQRRR